MTRGELSRLTNSVLCSKMDAVGDGNVSETL